MRRALYRASGRRGRRHYAEFRAAQRIYCMFAIGAGVAILIAAVMGLGGLSWRVLQTIYATTMDHIREFGTLKAIGALNRYLYQCYRPARPCSAP